MNTISKVLIDSDKNIIAIMSHTCSGELLKHVTFRAKITLIHNGQTIVYEDPENEKSGVMFDSGQAFDEYYWCEGNMACDCNLGRFVGHINMSCGETIEVLNVEAIGDLPDISKRPLEVAVSQAIQKWMVGTCENITEIKFEDPSSDGIIQPVKATGVTIKGDIATYQFYLIVKDTYN
jgi:hypothetical protein